VNLVEMSQRWFVVNLVRFYINSFEKKYRLLSINIRRHQSVRHLFFSSGDIMRTEDIILPPHRKSDKIKMNKIKMTLKVAEKNIARGVNVQMAKHVHGSVALREISTLTEKPIHDLGTRFVPLFRISNEWYGYSYSDNSGFFIHHTDGNQTLWIVDTESIVENLGKA